jgi:hypothetical protein
MMLRTLVVTALVALATPGLAVAQRPAPAATAEEVTQLYIAALGRGAWDELAGMMHPEALAEFRLLFAPVMNGERGREIGPQVFGVADSAAYVAASDSALFAHFLRASIGADPALASVMRTAKVLVLGHISEGPDVHHVVSRLTMTAEGLEFSRMDVMSLRRFGGTWRGLLTGDIRLLAQSLQASSRS